MNDLWDSTKRMAIDFRNRHFRDRADVLNFLALLAIGFGIIVRLSQFVSNRSLWGDEAWLALNIVNRSYLELLQPLDNNQAAPPLFLWLEKFAIQLFGNHEYSLRLFPLIASIVSMMAIYPLGKWAVSPIALPIAIALFACLKYPLYYATEAKPYSSDVMVALVLSLLLIPLKDKLLGKGKLLLLGIVGTLFIWISYTSIFVLAGLEASALILSLAKQRKAIFMNRLPVYLTWITSFLAVYLLITARVMNNQVLQNAWRKEYPSSIFDLIWLLDTLGRFFYNPLGFLNGMDVLAILAFILGCVALFRQHRHKLFILLAPVAATLMGSYLHKYHFRARLVLFLTPFFIFIIAEGITFLLSQFKRQKLLGVLGSIMAVALLIPSLGQAAQFMVYPETNQEIRPVIEYIKSHQQPEDAIYLDDKAVLQFEYYAPKYGYSESDYIPGYRDFVKAATFSKQQWDTFQKHSSKLQPGKRVWFLFSGLRNTEAASVKLRLDKVGQEVDYFAQPGVFTYLYRLK